MMTSVSGANAGSMPIPLAFKTRKAWLKRAVDNMPAISTAVDEVGADGLGTS
jgi:hypothetical protein